VLLRVVFVTESNSGKPKAKNRKGLKKLIRLHNAGVGELIRDEISPTNESFHDKAKLKVQLFSGFRLNSLFI
jgi:hypothetical protein